MGEKSEYPITTPMRANPEIYGNSATEFFAMQIQASNAFKILEPLLEKAIKEPSDANLKALDEEMLKMNPIQKVAFNNGMYLARPPHLNTVEHQHMVDTLHVKGEDNLAKFKTAISGSIARLEANGNNFPDSVSEAKDALDKLIEKNPSYDPRESGLGQGKPKTKKNPTER